MNKYKCVGLDVRQAPTSILDRILIIKSSRALFPVRAALLLAPFVVYLGAPSTTPALQTPQTPLQGPHQPTSDLITLDVVVNGPGESFVRGLNKSDFSVYDNNVLQEITSFSNDDGPLSICFVLDISGPIGGPQHIKSFGKRFGVLSQAAARFVQVSHQSNQYFVIPFNERPHVLVDGVDSNTVLAEIDKLDSLHLKGSTALYDACSFALEKVVRGAHSRKAIILISDGNDSASKTAPSKLERLLKEKAVPLYAMNVQPPTEIEVSGFPEAPLEEWAKMSGGLAFRSKNIKDLVEGLGVIAQELRNRYRLSFKPKTSPGDKKWHKIKVAVTLPAGAPRSLTRVIARSQQGYYAGTSNR